MKASGQALPTPQLSAGWEDFRHTVQTSPTFTSQHANEEENYDALSDEEENESDDENEKEEEMQNGEESYSDYLSLTPKKGKGDERRQSKGQLNRSLFDSQSPKPTRHNTNGYGSGMLFFFFF